MVLGDTGNSALDLAVLRLASVVRTFASGLDIGGSLQTGVATLLCRGGSHVEANCSVERPVVLIVLSHVCDVARGARRRCTRRCLSERAVC